MTMEAWKTGLSTGCRANRAADVRPLIGAEPSSGFGVLPPAFCCYWRNDTGSRAPDLAPSVASPGHASFACAHSPGKSFEGARFLQKQGPGVFLAADERGIEPSAPQAAACVPNVAVYGASEIKALSPTALQIAMRFPRTFAAHASPLVRWRARGR